MLKFILILFVMVTAGFNPVYAQQQSVDRFIAESQTPTYDCPASELAGRIDAFFQNASLTQQQRYALTVMQTHGQICDAKNDIAEQTLNALLTRDDVDRSTLYYASALYQLGFIYDVRGDTRRCEYYQRAQSLAENIYTDVHLSASLGLITECEGNEDEGVRLGKLFTLLERYSVAEEPGAVAHIHNNIGLLFGTLGQHVLAAEQYIKAHEIGLEVYTGSNQLSILISAITSLMASGNFDQAKETIEEFRRINYGVNTTLSNFWLLFAEAGYFYRTAQYDELRVSIAQWQEMKNDINNVTYRNLFRWYAAVLCLADKDKACLQTFLDAEAQTSDSYKAYVGRNKDYLKFITDVHFLLGNYQQAQQSYERFADQLLESSRADQASARILGIANLYSQINSLEASLERSQRNRDRLVIAGIAAAIVSLLILAAFLYHWHMTRESIDPVTQLLNNRTALRRIERIAPPSEGKTNALAIFDLGNFREVNRLVGSTKADLVLEQIANTLRDVTRGTDVVGRFAPEQFILCLPDIEEQTAKSFFERIREALENTDLGEDANQSISVRSAISIYIATSAFDDLDEILDDMTRSFDI
ncbi:GGDEF domain-containing protein [Alteromonas sp. ASW11-36]|uniref:diguanylate cyclase n=1 Tax=Alteromonas arenosi TaxID=3055817 RepID=A0ABT7SZI1_9ALTE|nr:GGDEF domain-containing protein [Alteromonas sp. ASW11-36]MDM7861595.1 GGDEF domain-containing protein [Alteromonas sp. ASW11-36]